MSTTRLSSSKRPYLAGASAMRALRRARIQLDRTTSFPLAKQT